MSEAEQVVDSGQGSEDDVEKEPAVDDGGEEVEEEKEEGYNMLQWSVINSQVHMLRQYVWLGLFTELDVKVTKKESKYFGKDPYEIADQMGAEEMMAEIERCRVWESSLTPFQRMVRQAKGDGSICCLLANMSKETLTATDSEGYSCIHWASVTGNERLLAKILGGLALRNGSSTEVLLIPTKTDGTPIELAAEMGHGKFLQTQLALFSRDIAQSESTDVAEIGQVLVASVLDIVARNGDTDALEAVVQVVGKPPQRLLKVAVENNRALVVAHLIVQHGLEPDDVKTDESSPSPGWPLRTACLNGWEEMVTLLVALPNSNPALTNERDGRNCIHWAAVNGSEQLMTLLLTLLAKRNLLQTMINARDVYLRDAPIKLICGKDGEGQPVWYYVLIRRNQEPFLENQNESGNFNITNYGSIIKTGQGAEPDEDTKNYIADCMDGRAELETQEPDCTPLHLAIAERNYQAATVLIKAGADVNARDHFGMTSLHYAVREESRDMCQILIEHGADVKAKDSDGHTAEDVAKVKDAGELVSLLSALAAN